MYPAIVMDTAFDSQHSAPTAPTAASASALTGHAVDRQESALELDALVQLAGVAAASAAHESRPGVAVSAAHTSMLSFLPLTSRAAAIAAENDDEGDSDTESDSDPDVETNASARGYCQDQNPAKRSGQVVRSRVVSCDRVKDSSPAFTTNSEVHPNDATFSSPTTIFGQLSIQSQQSQSQHSQAQLSRVFPPPSPSPSLPRPISMTTSSPRLVLKSDALHHRQLPIGGDSNAGFAPSDSTSSANEHSSQSHQGHVEKSCHGESVMVQQQQQQEVVANVAPIRPAVSMLTKRSPSFRLKFTRSNGTKDSSIPSDASSHNAAAVDAFTQTGHAVLTAADWSLAHESPVLSNSLNPFPTNRTTPSTPTPSERPAAPRDFSKADTPPMPANSSFFTANPPPTATCDTHNSNSPSLFTSSAFMTSSKPVAPQPQLPSLKIRIPSRAMLPIDNEISRKDTLVLAPTPPRPYPRPQPAPGVLLRRGAISNGGRGLIRLLAAASSVSGGNNNDGMGQCPSQSPSGSTLELDDDDDRAADFLENPVEPPSVYPPHGAPLASSLRSCLKRARKRTRAEIDADDDEHVDSTMSVDRRPGHHSAAPAAASAFVSTSGLDHVQGLDPRAVKRFRFADTTLVKEYIRGEHCFKFGEQREELVKMVDGGADTDPDDDEYD